MAGTQGVLVCARPAAAAAAVTTAAAAAAAAAGAAPRPFISTVAPSVPIGGCPLRSDTVRVAQPNPRARLEALQRHRAWLRQLSSKRRELLTTLEEELAAQERRRARVLAQAQQQRDRVRCVTRSAEAEAAPEAIEEKKQAAAAPEASPLPASHPQPPPPPPVHASDEKSGGECKRPAWSLSEAASAARDEAEVDSLLAFAQGLDVEAFLGDVELRAALTAIRSRVDALRAEAGALSRAERRLDEAEQREAAALDAEARASVAREVAASDKPTRAAPAPPESDAEAAAREVGAMVLAELADLRATHSRASAAAVAGRVAAEAAGELAVATSSFLSPLPQPRIAVAAPRAKLSDVQTPQLMPFLYRQ